MADQQPTEVQPQPVEGQTDGTQSQSTKIQFSAEQQTKVDELIRQAMGRAAKELRSEKEKLVADLELAQAQLSTYKESTSPELQKARELLAESEVKRTAAEQREATARRNITLREALDKADVLQTADAIKLLGDSFKWENDTLVAVDQFGAVRKDATGAPLSVDAIVAEFAQARPYMVRGSVKRGAGSTESTQFAKVDPKVEDIFGAQRAAQSLPTTCPCNGHKSTSVFEPSPSSRVFSLAKNRANPARLSSRRVASAAATVLLTRCRPSRQSSGQRSLPRAGRHVSPLSMTPPGAQSALSGVDTNAQCLRDFNQI